MPEHDVLTLPEGSENGGWYSNEAATFGDRVAAARETLGLSQSDLARKLGVKLKTVQGWEDDLSEPRANKLSMMAGMLNVSFRWLLSGEGDGPGAPDEAEALSPDMSVILTEIRDLRTQMTASADRLGRLEKALRSQLRDEALV